MQFQPHFVPLVFCSAIDYASGVAVATSCRPCEDNCSQDFPELTIATLQSAYTKKCVPALASCTGLTGNNNACLSGDNTCRSAVETPIENANDFNVYDVLEPSSSQSTDPPETYVDYLQSQSVMTAIGAQTTYGECPDTPYNKMVSSGDGKSSVFCPQPRYR